MAWRSGISTRADGTMLVATGDELDAAGHANRERFFSQLGATRSVVCRLVHGAAVRRVGPAEAGTIAWGVDALVTDTPGLFLGLTVADCFPVWFYDAGRGAVGLAHAGWRGLAGGVIEATATALRTEFGAVPEDLAVTIGPGIRQCHFAVRGDVLRQFSDYPEAGRRSGEATYLDLPSILRARLLAAGVPADQITDEAVCTYCRADQYFSYRREGHEPPDVMLAYAALVP